MPQQIPYTVKFPDGYVQKFQGPPDMSDSDVFARATQERAVTSGKIQTTWFGGAAKQMGQEKGANTALLTGAGMATGLAPVVALAPLAADWLDYATKAHTGEQADVPTLPQQATDVVQGVATAYGPKMIATGLKNFAASTVPHVSGITGQYVKGAAGSGVVPWAVRTAGEAANALETSPLSQAIQAAPSKVTGAISVATSLAAPILAQIKQSLTMAESKKVVEMRRKGKSEAEALQSIANQRTNK